MELGTRHLSEKKKKVMNRMSYSTKAKTPLENEVKNRLTAIDNYGEGSEKTFLNIL